MILPRGVPRAHTVRVRWVSEATRRTFALSVALSALLAVLPVDGPSGSVTVLSAALAVALAAGLLADARHVRLPAFRSDVSPDAPARDEKCRRGTVRRQSNPCAPGRVRPRAPQPA